MYPQTLRNTTHHILLTQYRTHSLNHNNFNCCKVNFQFLNPNFSSFNQIPFFFLFLPTIFLPLLFLTFLFSRSSLMCNHKKEVNLLGLTCSWGCFCLQFFILSFWVLCNYPNCCFLTLAGFACNFGIVCSIGLGEFSCFAWYSHVLVSLYLKFYVLWCKSQ